VQPHTAAPVDENVHGFVEELVRTGVMLADLLSRLLEDLPDDAFPGENTGEVLLEMLAGTAAPAARAAGEETVGRATALIGAVADRVLADLEAALELKRRG
jgi:hypothetical protein